MKFDGCNVNNEYMGNVKVKNEYMENVNVRNEWGNGGMSGVDISIDAI